MKKKIVFKKWMAGSLCLAAAAMLCGCGDGSAGRKGGDAADLGDSAGSGESAGGGDQVAQTNKSLKLTIMETDEDMYKVAFDKFRERYPDVDLQVETYPMGEMAQQASKQQTQIMAGEGPDLLLLTSFASDDLYKMMKAGAFAPMDAYIAADESWNGGADYVREALEAGKFDGSQYIFPLDFDSFVMVASEEGLEAVGVSVEDCKDTLSFMQQVASIYDKGVQGRVLGDVAQFGTFPEMLDGQFLDYKNEKINVDGDILRQACEAYSRMYAEDQGETAQGDLAYYGIGYDIARQDAYVYQGVSLTETLGAAGALASEATPTLIPLRDKEGNTLARVHCYGGIRANSENKQNAYNMLRILMDEETQEKFSIGHCPIHKAVINAAVDQIVEDDRAMQNASIPIGQLSDAFVTEYKSCLTDVGRCFFLNSISIQKFTDYMEPFYAGEADYDGCLKEFEDYIKIYLSE